MMTLALEFSSPRRSVAIVGPEANSKSPALLGEASDQGSRSVQPLALVNRSLEEAQVEREQIECIAVGLGPGSYTGIRSALALSQGWQLGRDIKLLGVSSVECLAAQAQENRWFGHVKIVIDAQRNEVYLAEYEISESKRHSIHPLRLVRAADITDGANASETIREPIIVGPEVNRWFVEGRLLFPEARMLGLLAQGRTDFFSAERLEPIYLRETKFVKAPPSRNWD